MEYFIKGGNLPVVICKLKKGETMLTESGGMIWMTPDMKMETETGGAGQMFSRMLSGEYFFRNRYTCTADEGEIAFGSCFPGSIRVVEISEDNSVIVQKRGFLASTPDVKQSLFLQKKIGAGIFGGNGFIMQKLTGKGLAFIEIDGATVEYDLKAGEKMIVNTGYIAMMDATCKMDIRIIKGVKNVLFGGEGLFNATVEGPGKILIQTMPAYALAGALEEYIVKKDTSSDNETNEE